MLGLNRKTCVINDGLFWVLFFPSSTLPSGSQEARVAKGGTGGAGVGAGGGAHNPSNRLPPGTWTNPMSFVITTDLWAVQLPQELCSGASRQFWLAVFTSGLPADDPVVVLPDVQKSVRTNSAVRATSASVLSLLGPFSLLLLLHWEHMKGLLLADISFRDDNEDSLWGWNHWLKKTGFLCPVLAAGADFKACKAQTDTPAASVLSNYERVSQSMCALSALLEDDCVLFPERSHGFVIFQGLFLEECASLTQKENMKTRDLKRNTARPGNTRS